MRERGEWSRSVSTGGGDGDSSAVITVPVPDSNILKRARRCLKQRFDVCQCSTSPKSRSRNEKSWNKFALLNVTVPRIHPARVLRSGANTLSRTLNSVQTTFGNISQKFRRSTKRRYQFRNESPCSPKTPRTRSRCMLGRTPTKLYSPFGIESPRKRIRGKENECESGRFNKKERIVNKNCRESPKSKRKLSPCNIEEAFNGQRKLDSDMEEIRIVKKTCSCS